VSAGDHLDGEALEVSGFRNGDEHRMIGALAMFREQAQRLLGVHRGVGEVFQEQLAGRVVRAAEGREDAALVQQLERAQVDLLVAAHGVHERLLVAGETRRIEDDEVVFRLSRV
jgi:hypothetical protein